MLLLLVVVVVVVLMLVAVVLVLLFELIVAVIFDLADIVFTSLERSELYTQTVMHSFVIRFCYNIEFYALKHF